jgi:DNA-binding NtrC family response regulator/pSer/pThr/pTyr-binding forkhead associated (FHA) protein
VTRDFDDLDTDAAGRQTGGARIHATISVNGALTSKLLPTTGTLTIGRSSTNDIVIPHISVSRHHATLCLSPLEIIDAGSHNGTFVRGRQVPNGVAMALHIGDAVQIGEAAILLQSVAQTFAHKMTRDTISDGVIVPHPVDAECARSARTGSPFAVVQIATRARTDDAQRLLRAFVRTTDIINPDNANGFQVVLVDTGGHDVATAVTRMTEHLRQHGIDAKLGVARYPLDGVVAEQLIAHAYEDIARDPAPTAMDHVRELVRNVATGDVSVLITGETGVGKELCAEMIHRLSSRRDKPFVKLNCSALVESLIESELFGHERGAFTGATSTHSGLLETGDGGTVFLDEIGELPLGVQAKLLRVLEERIVRRVGATTGKKVDVRFIGATNRDLGEEVEAGRFRRDLYYRINAVKITIPPLRERRSEIVALARTFASRARAGGSVTLGDDVMAALLGHRWSGNIRELRNSIERALLLSSGRAIQPSHLGLEADRHGLRDTRPTLPVIPAAMPIDPATEPPQRSSASLANEVAELERKRIIETLERCGGNQSQAARELGVSRGTLIARMEAYAIRRPRKG